MTTKKEYSWTVCYERITPESAEQGDFSDTGFEEDNVIIDTDDEEESIIDATVHYLKKNGVIMASTNIVDNCHMWFEQEFSYIDYGTGEQEQLTFHPHGYTVEELQQIYDRVIR